MRAAHHRRRDLLGRQLPKANATRRPANSAPSAPAYWHTCGVRTNGTVTCWGYNGPGPARRADRPIQRHQRRLPAHVRGAHRRHRDLLGIHLGPGTWPERRSGGTIHRCRCGRIPLVRRELQRQRHVLGQQRRWPKQRSGRTVRRGQWLGDVLVRTAHQQHHHLLGRQRGRPDRTRRADNSTPSERAGTMRADCAPTTPSPAGATTPTARPTRRADNSTPSAQACSMRADCAPTTPSPAGATTPTARPTRRADNSTPSARAGSIPADCAPTTPSPAGATTPSAQTDAPSGQFNAVSAGGLHACGLRTNNTITCWGYNANGQTDRAERTIQRRQRGRAPHLWTAHRRHHHLLGAPADGKPTTRRRSRLDSPPRGLTERVRPAK